MCRPCLEGTTLTPFELVLRSMRTNMKQDYLYFFALIFSTTLYFVFAALQHDSSMVAAAFGDVQFALFLRVSGILLLTLVVIFMIYANSIFLKRRSREIGLYQLSGLTRRQVVMLLMMENVLLGMGALLIGIGVGALVSRLFLLILMKLIRIESVVSLSFSTSAASQTVIAFALLIGITLVQICVKIYCTTLFELLQADRKGDHPQRPTAVRSIWTGALSLVLIATGYLLSSITPDQGLLLHMLIILSSTILGTYLLFRVTIGWLFYRIRRRMNGQLGLKNSLSLAPLMHRMRANASSLTLITVLSAVTLTMVSVAYSLYYSAEHESRAMLPFDFIFENHEEVALDFGTQLEKAGIQFIYHPLEGVRLTDIIDTGKEERKLLLLAAEQLRTSGVNVDIPEQGEAVWYRGQRTTWGKERSHEAFLQPIELGVGEDSIRINVVRSMDRYAMNFNVNGIQLVVREVMLKDILAQMTDTLRREDVRIDTYQITAKDDRAAASDLYMRKFQTTPFKQDFNSYYQASIQKFGLIMFVAGFLALIFLIATGSILYFKQMTEAEEERNSYRILRQLGFGEREILGGIIRKQLFVFAIPLAIGLVHSSFAVRAASAWTSSDITMPAAMAMSVYTIIYFVFAILTVGYYRRVVKLAM